MNYLKSLGFDYDFLLGNLGSSLVYLIILPFIYITVGFINLAGGFSNRFKNYAQSLNKTFFWNFPIKFVFS